MRLLFVLVATAMLSSAPVVTWAQDQSHETAAPSAAQAQTHDHAAMLAAEQAKADTELDQKLVKMESAKGNEKIALMADILKQLVAERKANASAPAQAQAPAAAGGHDMSCPKCASMGGGGMQMNDSGGNAPSAGGMNHGSAGMSCPMMAEHK